MASNKSKQKTQTWLKIFARDHNSRSDNGKRTTASGEKAMTDNGYKDDKYADDFGDNQGGTKKTVMWCLIAILVLLGILAYHLYNKNVPDAIAGTEVEVLDTISASRVSQVPEMKKQSVQPVQQEVATVPEPEPEQKQQAAPEQEKPVKTESEYAPNGEILIQKPVYPKNGFDSYQEQEDYFNTLEEYWKQQRRISDWKIQHDIE